MQISAYYIPLNQRTPAPNDLEWRTGGPRGQLAVHPAVAQFLLDNAASTALEENTGINAIDEILNILPMGFELVNGYLKIHDVDSKSESETLELLLKYLTLGYARVEVKVLWWKSMGVSRFVSPFWRSNIHRQGLINIQMWSLWWDWCKHSSSICCIYPHRCPRKVTYCLLIYASIGSINFHRVSRF